MNSFQYCYGEMRDNDTSIKGLFSWLKDCNQTFLPHLVAVFIPTNPTLYIEHHIKFLKTITVNKSEFIIAHPGVKTSVCLLVCLGFLRLTM